ncbi:zona pellucida sperm-binding protein 1-like [Denticeps clupeoides]|uniref:zona pellucida sperm-binding protein 1-like n=1 Tax=Denticeps clupeoides TaxID=299321 RepID=UPI0010A57E46|nr:zona pellucida sperm-binding protein 1-like [Denticeps clupeoides]
MTRDLSAASAVLTLLTLQALLCVAGRVRTQRSAGGGYSVGRAVVQVGGFSEEGLLFEDDPAPSFGVVCTGSGVQVWLPDRPLDQIELIGPESHASILELSKSLGYEVTKDGGHNILTVSFPSCYVTLEGSQHTLQFQYGTDGSQVDVTTVSCPVDSSSLVQADSPLNPKPVSCQKSTVPPPPPPPTTPPPTTPPPPPPTTPPPPPPTTRAPPPPPPTPPVTVAQAPPVVTPCPETTPAPTGCSIPPEQQVPCSSDLSAADCADQGFCVDPTTQKCFYPMDACTADKNFVFTINQNITTLPLDLSSLMVVGPSRCRPVIVRSDFVIFKFPLTACGARSYEVGDFVVYMAEIQPQIKALRLNYGTICRDNPFRVIVECRYQKAMIQSDVTGGVMASVGYMVAGPAVPAPVAANGRFGVQLLIAEDQTFTTFLPQSKLPLRMLLGKPLYLQLQVISPKPAVVLLVNYCVAYTRSAKSALVLLYEGCPNALDSSTTSVLFMSDLPQNRHQRRFVVNTFQFMNVTAAQYLNEEIYFMCSTEICMPGQKVCAETCFDKPAAVA